MLLNYCICSSQSVSGTILSLGRLFLWLTDSYLVHYVIGET